MRIKPISNNRAIFRPMGAADSELRVVWSAGVASFGDVLEGWTEHGRAEIRGYAPLTP
jgi:hypothetical protein